MRSERSTGERPGTRVAVDGGWVVTPDTVFRSGRVVVGGNRIAGVYEHPAESPPVDGRVDAAGRYVLPGLVDLHGDDIERYLFPRSGDRVAVDAALVAADRLTLAAGVTTKFDAVAFENAPEKNRSVETAVEVVDTVARDPGLVADHRVHARCEVTDPESVTVVGEVAGREIVDIVSAKSSVCDLASRR
jgi:alpha-D-ribose 1-methylphosphonate 5-triphosphate diphosphatase